MVSLSNNVEAQIFRVKVIRSIFQGVDIVSVDKEFGNEPCETYYGYVSSKAKKITDINEEEALLALELLK